VPVGIGGELDSVGSTGGVTASDNTNRVSASSSEAFPALPSAATLATSSILSYNRDVSRRDVGVRDTVFTWGARGSGSAQNNTAGKGKKKTGKQKIWLPF